MVRDILWDAASFLDYASLRGELSQAGVQIYVESDALGGYLQDRLLSVRNKVGYDLVLLGYSSRPLNDYFTRIELGTPRGMPQSSVPTMVRQGLLETGIEGNSVEWWDFAMSLVQQASAVWVRWRRFLRRHGPGRVFLLPDRRAGLLVSDSTARAEISVGTPLVLVLPANGWVATS
jgi:hypothetical protein